MITDDLIFLATTRSENADFRISKYIPDYYTVQYMERGKITLAYDKHEQILEGEWFWTAYPGPYIRFHAAPGTTSWFHRHVGFRGPRVQEWIASGIWFTEAQPSPPGREWGDFFDTLSAETKRGDRWGNLRATNLLENLLIELAEARTQTEPAHQPWLQSVLNELGGGDRFVPNYAGIARMVGMGESTLRRRFKEATGLSPQEYVLQTRLARARALLTDTDLTLSAIAEQLEYDTVPFFSRQFKERVGITPGAFRRTRHG
ncbi:MAG: AraC family transcriptional regulator [Fibrella sp.]|nr:AraC family transcriptional regulator [Armatimonadota bacterium]